MKNQIKLLLAIFVVLLTATFFAPEVKAQTCNFPENTTVSGNVLKEEMSPKGRIRIVPASNVYVFAQDPNTPFPSSFYVTTTDFDGNYAFTDLPTCSQFRITLQQPNCPACPTVNSNPQQYQVFTGFAPTGINFTILLN